MSYRTFLFVAIAFAAGFAAIHWLGAAEEPVAVTVSPEKIKQLMNRMERLEARIELLERRPSMRIAPRRNAQLIPAPVPQVVSPEADLPEGWQRREFNGLFYYLAPLDSAADKAQSKLPRR